MTAVSLSSSPSVPFKIWTYVWEFGIKEFPSVIASIWYRAADWICPVEQTAKKIQKVVIFIHGDKSHPSTFRPWLQTAISEKVQSELHTITYSPTEENPVPLEELNKKIEDIRNRIPAAQFCLVGHSLGAIISAKKLYLEHSPYITQMISIDGRVHFVRSKLDWMAEKERATLLKIEKVTKQANVFTIHGGKSPIPIESVHYQKDPNREFTDPEAGHLGVLYSKKAIQWGIEKIKDWESAQVSLQSPQD